MRFKSLFSIVGTAGLILAGSWASAEPTYVGVDKCKICHKVEFASWLETHHATAIDKLKPEERTDASCLKCHATGGRAELPGVQCEACHGPGSGYKSMAVMKDPAAARGAGLLLPDAAACRSCHEKAPHDIPAFDYEKAKLAGIHAVKAQGGS